LIGSSEKFGPTRRSWVSIVGEQTPLQQGIVGEVDSRHHVAGMEGDLLGLREKVIGVAVQRQLADTAHRNEFLRDDLGRIE
jgi:hypothetical protein